MNKKSIGAVLLSAALFVAGTGATFAYFTNKTQTDVVSFTTGNVKVQFLSAQETNWRYVDGANNNKNSEIDLTNKANATKVAPGDKITKTFTLQNNGSLDAKVRMQLKDMTANSDKVEDHGFWIFHDYDCVKAYTVGADGKVDAVKVNLEYDADGKNIKYITLDAKHDETVQVEMTVTLDPTMGNGNLVSANNPNGPATYSNFDKQFDLQLVAEATQWNNPGWDQAGN
ncbi:hypothetical protein CFOLD11_40300 [Clostridium folliculivorans]|uniref:Camelysin metallo-endopeptidase n=1 Tax=Clostridium folliculivorans TaxID=2886038 RepID=A0A9W5Y651_9CLOT|nr:CalY family protein [Clostridium folliculivorans]GKU27203.1 hypothetical protein CFOLD11_40300 [Clostridium folliculivorans]